MLRKRKCLRRMRWQRDEVKSIVSPDFRPGVTISIKASTMGVLRHNLENMMRPNFGMLDTRVVKITQYYLDNDYSN